MISVIVISKDEIGLDETLECLRDQNELLSQAVEICVVDASQGRLSAIQKKYPEVKWVDYRQPADVKISIPHQRNEGIRLTRGEIVVFTDSGCILNRGWLEALTTPIATGAELVTAGLTLSREGSNLYDARAKSQAAQTYLHECATINMAFARSVIHKVGGFDERFEYGSDIDFSWRLVDVGIRIRSVPTAIVAHEWGSPQRQLKRSFKYGRARCRLFRKHRTRRRRVLQTDPVVVIYPLFLLGLPFTLFFPMYPLLLIIPAWRNRSNGPLRVLANHLAFAAGVLVELVSA